MCPLKIISRVHPHIAFFLVATAKNVLILVMIGPFIVSSAPTFTGELLMRQLKFKGKRQVHLDIFPSQ